MDSEDGQIFVKNLAQFVRTHEKALANALQLRRQDLKLGRNGSQSIEASPNPLAAAQSANSTSSISSALAAALSLGSLSLTSHSVKPAKLTLTSHHLFYLLSRFEEAGIAVGPLNVRTENLQSEASPANYVSFLGQSQRPHGRSDRDSIHSVSSVRSVMSGMSAMWFGLGSANSVTKTEKAHTQLMLDLKYLYSAFTKIPCLRLTPDRKARLIRGSEEFPFDTAVPLLAFKNLSALEICDVDFRHFFGWDKLAERLRSLTLKRAHIDDPTDLFTSIVLDDMDKRRRRSSKAQSSPVLAWPLSPPARFVEAAKIGSTHCPQAAEDNVKQSTSPQNDRMSPARNASSSPHRPTSSRQNVSLRHVRSNSTKIKRSGSGSSDSSVHSVSPTVAAYRSGSSSNLLLAGTIPSSKWRFLRHLSLADNSLTSIPTDSLTPVANSLHSLDLSSNLFTEVPDGLTNLIVLRALNVSNCMIGNLQSLIRSPLPAINALNLRANRLTSIAGVERLLSLERLDLRENKIDDPTELARLTGLSDFREVWIVQNPLTKRVLPSSYRVMIFNLFRNTPGLINDIFIDASGPAYNERKQLMNRVAESEPVSVVCKAQPETQINSPAFNETQHAETIQRGIDSERLRQEAAPQDLTPDGQYSSAKTANPRSKSASRIAAKSRHSKKGTRRQRLVDLAAAEEMPQQIDPRSKLERMDGEPVITPEKFLAPSSLANVESPSDLPRLQHQASPRDRIGLSPVRALSSPLFDRNGGLLSKDSQHTTLQAQAYRHRMEAFKQEVGSNWLSALSDEGWVSDRKAHTVIESVSAMRRVRPEIPLLPHS